MKKGLGVCLRLLPSLEFRHLRDDMIQTFNITHGFYDDKTTQSLFNYSIEIGSFMTFTVQTLGRVTYSQIAG